MGGVEWLAGLRGERDVEVRGEVRGFEVGSVDQSCV